MNKKDIIDPGYDPIKIFKIMKILLEDENKLNEVNDLIIKYYGRIIELITASLLNTDPFYGAFLMRTGKFIDITLPAPAGVRMIEGYPEITFNPIFLIEFTTKQVTTVIKHEFLHLMHFHLLRSKNYDIKDNYTRYAENIAMDAAINQYFDRGNVSVLKPHEKELPPGAITLPLLTKMFDLDERQVVSDKEYEYYFTLILQSKKYKETMSKMDSATKALKEALNKIKSNNGNGSSSNQGNTKSRGSSSSSNDESDSGDSSGFGNATIKDLKNALNQANAVDMHETWENSDCINENDMKSSLVQVLNEAASEARGCIPAEVSSLIKKITAKPIISWQKELRNMIGSVRVPYVKTLRKRSRRLPDRLDIPGKRLNEILSIAVAIDTSGSVSDTEISYIFNEIFNILKTVNFKLTIIECDAIIQRIYTIEKRENVETKVKGRGGTCFTPVFKWLSELKSNKKPDILIYFTDGYGERTIEEKYKPSPKTKIMWVLTGNNTNNLSVINPFTKKVKTLHIREDY